MLSIILLTFGYCSLAFPDIVVIVNPASGVNSLSLGEAKKIFLIKKKNFPNGEKAKPVEQAEGSATRDIFNNKVLKKNNLQYKAYWSKIIFSGKGIPPKSMADDATVKTFVAATIGAIGYVDSGLVDSSVKVVLTIK